MFDGPTDGRDGRTDKAGCIVACTRLKTPSWSRGGAPDHPHIASASSWATNHWPCIRVQFIDHLYPCIVHRSFIRSIFHYISFDSDSPPSAHDIPNADPRGAFKSSFSLIHSFIHSFILSFIHAFTCHVFCHFSLTLIPKPKEGSSFIQSFIFVFILSFIHSFNNVIRPAQK